MASLQPSRDDDTSSRPRPDRPPEPRRLLGVRELAETLSISSSQVYDLIRRAPKPFPPPIRLLGPGSRPKWRVADVDAFLAALAAEEERAARVLPSLEEPPAGALCPSCAEELRLIGYCAACGWRGEESGTC